MMATSCNDNASKRGGCNHTVPASSAGSSGTSSACRTCGGGREIRLLVGSRFSGGRVHSTTISSLFDAIVVAGVPLN